MIKDIIDRKTLQNIASIAAFFIMLVYLFIKTDVRIAFDSFASLVRTAMAPLCIILLALAVGFGVKYILAETGKLTLLAKDTSSAWRDRLAERVVTFGIGALAAMGITVIVATWGNDDKQLGVFNSVLPVISTWIGTVLAFYFSKESFRQAAESQGRLAGGAESITRPGTMVAIDKTVKYELSAEFIKTCNNNPIEAAEKTELNCIRNRFQPPGIMRVIIFDDKKIPIYVLRYADLPAEQQNQTVLDYLNLNGNKERALNFSCTSRRATIGDGRRLVQIRNVTDLFITENGRADEPVLGWVPVENL